MAANPEITAKTRINGRRTQLVLAQIKHLTNPVLEYFESVVQGQASGGNLGKGPGKAAAVRTPFSPGMAVKGRLKAAGRTVQFKTTGKVSHLNHMAFP
jgi:hypothetical protein